MSIRIRTVANRAKTLNEVLAIGVKRSSLDELNDVNQILKSVFTHEVFQTLVHLAALEQAARWKQEFSDEKHKATTGDIDEMLAEVINYIGDDHMTLEEAILRAVNEVAHLIYWHENAAVPPSYPTEQARLNTRQVNIERAQGFVKRGPFFIDESASSRLKERVFSNHKLIYNSQDA